MTISLRAVGTSTAAAGAVTGVTAGVPAGVTATDISILTVEIKGSGATPPTITTPTGWTLIGVVTNNGTAGAGTDTGSNTIGMYYRIGTYTAPTITTTDANSMGAGIVAYAGTVGDWDVTGTTNGSDTSSAANASITGAADLGLTTGDWVIVGVGVSGDIGSVTAETLAATGATIGTRATRINRDVTTGFDSRLLVSDWPVTAGTSTAAPVYTYTNTSATTSHARFVRLREVALPPPSAPSDAYGQAVFADTPVAWYRADGSAVDYMQGAAGTLTGGTYGAALLPTLPAEQSFDLDGVDDYVNIPDQAQLAFGAPITVEAWFQADTLTGAGAIVSRESATTAEEFELYHNGTTLQWWIRGITTCTFEITTGTAYHVVATWDGSTARMYVNNVAATPVAATMTVPVFDGNLRIGSWNGSSEFLDGRVSEVAIYDRVLSSTEVGEHYTAGTTSGGSTVTGIGALTASATTLAGAGTVTVTGSGSLTATAATLGGAGTATVTGSGALTAQPATATSSGTVTVTGQAALAATPPSVTGAGALALNGSGALTAAPADLAAAGTITPVGVGTGALTANPASLSGTGTASLNGTAALEAPPAALSGAGTSTVTGSGALAATPAELSGAGTITPAGVGTGALTPQSATLTGAGSLKLTGTGGLAGPAAGLSAAGTLTVVGAAELNAQAAALATIELLIAVGSGALTAPPAVLSGSGTVGDQQSLPTPPERTLGVARELRAHGVASDNRTATVPAEARTLTTT